MLAAPTVTPEHPDGFGGRDVSADPRSTPPPVRVPAVASQAADQRHLAHEFCKREYPQTEQHT